MVKALLDDGGSDKQSDSRYESNKEECYFRESYTETILNPPFFECTLFQVIRLSYISFCECTLFKVIRLS